MHDERYYNGHLLKELICQLALCRALEYSPREMFQLRHLDPDRLYHFYARFRARLTEGGPQALLGTYLAGFVRKIMGDDRRTPLLIPIPTGGIPLVSAASVASAFMAGDMSDASRIAWRPVREVPTVMESGRPCHVDGGPPDLERYRPIIIDNALTTGKSFLDWADLFEKEGFPVKSSPIIFFIEREYGGYPRVLEKGYAMARYITSMTHVVDVLVDAGIWPEEAKRHLEREILLR